MTEKAEIVFASGKFRVIHAGHMRLLRTATDYGNKLVVGLDTADLTADEIHWRESILNGINYVDEVS